MKPFKLSIILGVTGTYQYVEGLVESTLQSLEIASKVLQAEIIIGFDDPHWRSVPMVQTIENRFSTGALKVFFADQPNTLAGIYNQGASLTEAATFLLYIRVVCRL